MNKQADISKGEAVDPGLAPPLVSWPFFQLENEKCIKCLQCVRICDEVQHRSVYTTDASGYPALVSGTDDFRDTQCNNCGQCVGACPIGGFGADGFSDPPSALPDHDNHQNDHTETRCHVK